MDILELKNLAECVKGWSNCNQAWVDSENENIACIGSIDEDGELYPVAVIDCEQYFAESSSIKLAKFYANANPKAISNLIAEITALRARVAELQRDKDRFDWLIKYARTIEWFEIDLNIPKAGRESLRDNIDKSMRAQEPNNTDGL